MVEPYNSNSLETELEELLEDEGQHDVHSEFKAGENIAKETK